jgi:2-oxopent-4-enoate/cis-2-oxohex-4-enoate hydratase
MNRAASNQPAEHTEHARHTRHAQHADELFRALRERRPVAPLTDRIDALSIADAYHISRGILDRRLAAGELLIGKKTGVTSKAVQNLLGVHQPDFGYLTDAMQYPDGAELPISRELIQPRAEGELAFVLARDLTGPGVTDSDVIAATECIRPCIEVVDSRIVDWKIRIQDTIADNASSGLFVLGEAAASPRGFDFYSCGMVVEKRGEVVSTGAGAAALGSPVHCVTWLANTLGGFEIPLRAGEIILSGSLVPLEPVQAGDSMKVTIAGLGTAAVRFA